MYKSTCYYVYIVANSRRTVFYIGITNSLERRIVEHKQKLNRRSFTSKYNVDELVYYEVFGLPVEAIRREKVLKGWKRERKIALVRKANPRLWMIDFG